MPAGCARFCAGPGRGAGGEIRDGETAQIAVQASLTGHLVLSTLHTNSALGPFRVCRIWASSRFALHVAAGRHVAASGAPPCPHCRQSQPADTQTAGQMAIARGTPLWRAVGCAECSFTGYRGRTGIHELLRVDDRVRMAIHRGENELTLIQQLGSDYTTLRDAGRDKVLAGITSWEEVVRVTEQRTGEAD